MSSREKVSDQYGIQQNIRPVAVSVVAGVVVCIALLVLFSVVMSTQSIPQSLVSPMATLSVSVGALAGGYLCAKLIRRRGLVCGLVTGAIMAVVLILASFGVSDTGLGVPAVFKVVFILLSAMLGGVMGVNTRRRRSAKR